jgi:hypothetical protein
MVDYGKAVQDAGDSSEIRKKLQVFFEEFCSEALAGPQDELFYGQKSRQLQNITSECIPVITRRLQKTGWAEQDVLVQLLAQFSGVEHVSFLQEFVGREAFMPKTGMRILDIFNKSDVIISSGVAGSLLDYDNFAQRIIQACMSDAIDDGLSRDFLACSQKQQDGIAAQLLEDYGPRSAPFLACICAADKKSGERIFAMLESCSGEQGFRVMEAMYAADGRKDILKRMKKAARALAQKGISVALPDTAATGSPVFQAAGLPAARAFASTIDAEGYRILFLLKPVSTHESKVFHIVTNDTKGIHSFEVFAAIRGESSQMIKKLLNDTKSDFHEIETERCVALAMESVEIARARNQIIPATVAQLEAHFADSIGKDRTPAIYGVFSADEVAALEPAPDTGLLVDTMEIAFWYIVTPEGRNSWEQLSRHSKGRVEENSDQVRVVAAEALASFFTSERKRLFKRRLEELAFILHTKGHVNHARTALAAALKLASPDHDAKSDPFCVRMIDRAFEIFQQSLKETADGPDSRAASGRQMNA